LQFLKNKTVIFIKRMCHFMEEILFSFGAVLQSEMNNQKINNPDIAKKLGISVNGTYDSISKFKENKGNLQKFINYVTALDKKVQFVFKKENTVIRNCWTAGTLLEFIMEKESIKTKELPDKLHKTYQELCRQLKSLKENKGTISTLIEWSSALGYTVTVELI